MTPKFKLTIITVCYNDLAALKLTIEGLQSQSCADFEQIVIDGGSRDGTATYLQESASSSPIPYTFRFLSERDGGLYDAMNKGLDSAKGEWLWFLNAGDLPYGPDTVKKMLTTLDKNDKKVPMHFFQTECRGAGFNYVKGGHFKAEDFLMNMPVCHQGVLYRVKYLVENNYRYDLRFRISADHELTLRILRQLPNQETIPFSQVVIAKYNLEGISSKNLFQLISEQASIAGIHFPEKILEARLKLLWSRAICVGIILMKWFGVYGNLRLVYHNGCRIFQSSKLDL